MLTCCLKRIQLLRSIGHSLCERHVSIHDRHLPNPIHLDRLSWSWLGEVQVAPDRGFRHARVLHLCLQRHCTASPEVPADGRGGRRASPRGASRVPYLDGRLGLVGYSTTGRAARGYYSGVQDTLCLLHFHVLWSFWMDLRCLWRNFGNLDLCLIFRCLQHAVGHISNTILVVNSDCLAQVNLSKPIRPCPKPAPPV